MGMGFLSLQEWLKWKSDIKRETVNLFLRRVLGPYFVVIWVLIVIGATHQVGFHEGFNIGDWLVNYQGGFVRRGFIGEIVYLLSKSTGFNPAYYVVMIQSIIFAIFFFFSWKILKETSDLVKYAFLIFSPFLFTFAINSQAGGYRKEIIYFTTLSFIVYAHNTFAKKTFNNVFFAVLALYPFVILTDEVGIVILPVLLSVFLRKNNPLSFSLRNIPIPIFFLMVENIACFLIVFFNHQISKDQVSAIINSIKPMGYDPTGSGAIGALSATTKSNMKDTFHSIVYGHYFAVYPLAFFLVSLSFYPVWSEVKRVFSQRLYLLGILGSFFILIPVYVITNDWGRWTYILIMELFMLLLIKNENESPLDKSGRWMSMERGRFAFIVFLLLCYASFWYLPHVLEDGSDWRSVIHNIPFLST